MVEKFSQKGFLNIILVVVLVAFVSGGGVYLLLSKRGSTNQTTNQEIIPANPVSVGWKKFHFKYGQLDIQYPPTMTPKYVFNLSSTAQYVDFSLIDKNGVVVSEPVVTLRAEPLTSKNDIGSSFNFTVPGLGNDPNALFNQTEYNTQVSFTKNSVLYVVSVDFYRINQYKLEPNEVNNILTQMSKSITFTSDQGDCNDPVLKPLTGFPVNFVLSNIHDSDGKDKVVAYWPNIKAKSSEQYYLDQTSSERSSRGFLVSYIKDGEPFTDAEFEQKVAPITGSEDIYATGTTSLFNVNCLDQWKENNYYQPYYIDAESNDPYAVAMYGKADNPQRLWGVDKWNVALLKDTRNTVFVKKGNTWQKYLAKDYYVTIY